jgi:hypothetical protein
MEISSITDGTMAHGSTRAELHPVNDNHRSSAQMTG